MRMDYEALRADVERALAMLSAPGFDNNGGPASIADEIESLLSIEHMLLWEWCKEHSRARLSLSALKRALATLTARGDYRRGEAIRIIRNTIKELGAPDDHCRDDEGNRAE